MLYPAIDTEFAWLAIAFLETGYRELLPEIVETRAARHIAAHAQRVAINGTVPGVKDLVAQILTSLSLSDVALKNIRERLLLIENDHKTQLWCYNEAANYLPKGALDGATLFLTLGYDIGVAVNGNASLNLAHPHFAEKPEEFWFYCVHELHHAGFQRFNRLPRLFDVTTTRDLADLVRYLTTMEGLAVHAARRWRNEAGALWSDPDYVALLDQQRLNEYKRDFFLLYHNLLAAEPRLLEESDWQRLERLSTDDRLWYRVGALMAYDIEKELGCDMLIETVVKGPAAFFDQYADLVMKQIDLQGKPE